MVCYSSLSETFPWFVVIHAVNVFSVATEAEVDAFLELSDFFYDPIGTGYLLSGFSAFSKSSLNIWKFSVHEASLGEFWALLC